MEFYVVNSFAGKPFGGNPAAVFPEAGGLDVPLMQAIARQMNLVETVFIFPSGEADFHFRYFTPEEELPVAGHPTVAAVLALIAAGRLDASRPSRCGILTGKEVCRVDIAGGAADPVVFMEQPKPVFGAVEKRRALVAETLGIGEEDLLPDLPAAPVDTGLGHLVVPVTSLEALFRIRRNTQPLRALCRENGVREVQAFAFEALDPANRLHTRNICPREGVEDPACGVGCGALGAYLMRYYCPNEPCIDIRAEQGNIVNMPSVIQIRVSGQGDGIRVSVGGTGRVMIKGSFFLE